MSGRKPLASVIMRTKNSAHVVGQALSALFSQSYQDFELIIVDSGSTDDTLKIIEGFPHTLFTVESEAYIPGVVLNMAASNAKGEVLVFQNSDTIPLTPFALERLLKPFDDEQIMATFARQIPRPEALAWVKKDYEKSFPPTKPAPEWMRLSLPFAAMRKSAWERAPFYTDAWASEDTEWGERAFQRGWGIEYVPEAVVMHSHNYSLRALYGRRYVEGEADAFIYGQSARFKNMVFGLARSLASDAFHFAKRRETAAIIRSFALRPVYHWAHYRGLAFGENRKQKGDKDLSHGKKIILSRYES